MCEKVKPSKKQHKHIKKTNGKKCVKNIKEIKILTCHESLYKSHTIINTIAAVAVSDDHKIPR